MRKPMRGVAIIALGVVILGGGLSARAAADDDSSPAPPGTIDDGKDLLPRATLTLDGAIQAAQSAGAGPVGEVDLEYVHGVLVFNVEVGNHDVKVDATNGEILDVVADD